MSRPRRTPEVQTEARLAVWRDLTLTTAEALRRLDLSSSAAYRVYGPRDGSVPSRAPRRPYWMSSLTVPSAEAQRIWHDRSLTVDQAAARLGVSLPTAYKYLGRRQMRPVVPLSVPVPVPVCATPVVPRPVVPPRPVFSMGAMAGRDPYADTRLRQVVAASRGRL